MADLRSARAKLRRAEFHIEAANQTVRAFVSTKFYQVSVENDKPGRIVIKVVDVKPFPDDLALLVGDAAHNLRSSLDHIAFAFARKPLSREEERRIQFPLTSNREAFRGEHKRRLLKLPGNARTLIDRFQPYHRRKWRGNGLLGQLQAINNWDKHRSLPITATQVKRTTLRIELISGDIRASEIGSFQGPLKNGVKLARFNIENLIGKPSVKMTGKIVVIPVFDKGMPKEVLGQSVLNRLKKIKDYVADVVLPEFEKIA